MQGSDDQNETDRDALLQLSRFLIVVSRVSHIWGMGWFVYLMLLLTTSAVEMELMLSYPTSGDKN